MHSMLRRRPLYAPVTGGGGGIMQYPTPAAYVGPGDLGIGSAVSWFGLRAYSAATAGTKAVRVQRPDTTPADVLTNATTGALITTGAFWTGGPYTVITFYDQVSTGDMSALTGSVFLNLTGFGAFPTLEFVASNSTVLRKTVPVTQAPAFTVVGAARHTASGAQQVWYSSNGSAGGFGMQFRTSANDQASMWGGTANDPLVAGVTDGTFHSFAGVSNGGSSFLSVNGSKTLSGATPGSGTFDANLYLGADGSGAAQFFDGSVIEAGYWNGALTDPQISSLNSNQRTYWGY